MLGFEMPSEHRLLVLVSKTSFSVDRFHSLMSLFLKNLQASLRF